MVYFDLFDRLKDVNVSNNKAQNVAVKLNELSEITEEFDCHASLLVQINREVEKKIKDKRPKIWELKDSGSYEDYARLILLLYREKVYVEESMDTTAEVIVAKQSNGPTGTLFMDFEEDTLCMVPLPEQRGIE